MATFCLSTNLGLRLLIFHAKLFFFHKKSLLLKIYDDIILHVICKLPPPPTLPINNPDYVYAGFQEIFVFGCFSFQPIKKQCYPRAEDRIFLGTCRVRGQGLELWGQGQGLQNVSSRTASRPRTFLTTPPLV